MLSDDESAGEDIPEQIPAKAKKPGKKAAEPVEEPEDDDEEGDEEEYTVEKILNHDWLDNGSVVYEIKWLGYEKKADRTWEPIENLETAKEALDEYHDSIGGPPGEKPPKGSSAKKGKKGKRGASEAFDDSPAPTSTKKRGRKSDVTNGAADTPRNKLERFDPPNGLWEDDCTRVISILEDSITEKAKRGAEKEVKTLMGLLEWNSGHKTQHKMTVLRLKCPQKLLDYYEQHL